MKLLITNGTPNDTKQDILDLITGMLEGFQIAGAEIDTLIHCLNQIPDFVEEGEAIIHEFSIIIENIKHFDWKHIPEIVEAVQQIMKMVQSLFYDMQECTEAGSEIKHIIDVFLEMTGVEFIQRVKDNMLKYGGRLFTDIYDAFTAFKAGNYHKFGKEIADFLYVIVFGETQNNTVGDIYLLIKGLLEGLKVAGADIDRLLECFTDLEKFYLAFGKTIQKFKEFDLDHLPDILEGIKMLYDIVLDILDEISMCKEIPIEIREIIDLYKAMTWEEFQNKLMLNILLHSGKLLDDIQIAVDSWENKQYQEFGRTLGDFIWTVFQP